MTRLVKMVIALSVLAAPVVAQEPEPDQRTGPQTPPLVISSMVGRELFEFYCASCHGRDGKGGGPTVPALKARPPDLTTISQRHGGAFPRAHVEAYVTGAREVAAHGSQEMPVWGPIFKALDPNDAVNRVRITNIVGYIESMQTK